MNVPPATVFHRLRARARLVFPGNGPKIATWTIVNPGEDPIPFAATAPPRPLAREKGLALAEELGAKKLALVFFVGPSPTHWPDIFDAAEILRRSGAACVLATRGSVVNAMSAPVIAYHFTTIFITTTAVVPGEDLKGLSTLAALQPRGRVEARIFGQVIPEKEKALREAGADRVLSWPPASSRESLIISADGTMQPGESPWCADHIRL